MVRYLVLSKFTPDTPEVHSWFTAGTFEVYFWYAWGSLTVRSWSVQGFIVVQFWYSTISNFFWVVLYVHQMYMYVHTQVLLVLRLDSNLQNFILKQHSIILGQKSDITERQSIYMYIYTVGVKKKFPSNARATEWSFPFRSRLISVRFTVTFRSRAYDRVVWPAKSSVFTDGLPNFYQTRVFSSKQATRSMVLTDYAKRRILLFQAQGYRSPKIAKLLESEDNYTC